MKTPIFSSGGCGPGLSDHPGAPASSTEMPASVLEPLQARSSASGTNPFEQYEAPDTSAQISETGGACTAFASVPDRDSGGGHAGNSSPVLYPEGLPRFLGLLRPTMTFGIGHSTLSRGMDFIAHFVAVTTLVCFFGIIITVSWMQKLCLPLVRYWNHNYTLGFGAFMAVLGESLRCRFRRTSVVHPRNRLTREHCRLLNWSPAGAWSVVDMIHALELFA